jgi:ZIP family zinc transporter
MPEVLTSSLLAGLATVLGGIVVMLFGQPSTRLLAFLLGLASGVMLAVVAVDLVPSALEHGTRAATATGFAAGVLLLAGLDNSLSRHRRHRRRGASQGETFTRLGILVALGIALHDLPEGLAIGAGFAATHDLGAMISLAIGLHNIPEGIGMSAPLLFGGWKPWKVLLLCLAVAMVTPLGTILSLVILNISPIFIAVCLAFAAGAMVFVVADELIPVSHDSSRFLTSFGLTFGFVLIVLVL